MEQQNRLTLQSNFRTGDRPTQEDFENVFESFINIQDDKVSVDNDLNLNVGGAITLGDSGESPTTAPLQAGTIRWNGSKFEGYDGTAWGSLGGDESPWTTDNNNLLFSTGNVGIGSLTTAPTDVLEVAVGETRRVKLGNAAIGNGPSNLTRNNALFSHTSLRTQTSYALMQDTNGATYVNSASGQNIWFGINNIPQVALNSDGNFYVGLTDTPIAEPLFKLQVYGSAYKSDGGDSWNSVSDIRTKEDVQSFYDGMDMLKKIEPIRFKYNGKASTQKGLECIGISAQDFEKIFPYMVSHSKINSEKSGIDSDELLTTNLSALKFVMVNAIKELDSRLERLEKLSKKNKQDVN